MRPVLNVSEPNGSSFCARIFVDVKSQKCLVGEDILTDGFTGALLVLSDSSNMTMDDWVQIAKDIKSSYNLYDG